LPGAQALWTLYAPILVTLPRVSAALIVAPLFPATLFPMFLRGAIGVSLSLYLYPHMAAHMPAELPILTWLGLVAKESFIGALLGFAVGTLIWAFECAGAVIDFQVGFGNAQFFDPFGGHESGLVAVLMMRLGTILFLAAGGLQVVISLLFESFRLWPAVSFYPSWSHFGDFADSQIASFMDLVVRLAAPVVLLLALVDLGFGLVGRVVPQLNVFLFTTPIKAALAALMIALYLAYASDVLVGQVSGLRAWLEHLQPILSAH
jgi:type III secretion protein T